MDSEGKRNIATNLTEQRELMQCGMTLKEQSRALNILQNMVLERVGWRAFFSRWIVGHEPLRHDAANFLRDYFGCGGLRYSNDEVVELRRHPNKREICDAG